MSRCNYWFGAYWPFHRGYQDAWGMIAEGLVEKQKEVERRERAVRIQTWERLTTEGEEILIVWMVPFLIMVATVWPGFFTNPESKVSLLELGNPITIIVWLMLTMTALIVFDVISSHRILANLKREEQHP